MEQNNIIEERPKATAEDRKQLRSALLDLSKPDYERVRTNLIVSLGYDQFRELQNSIFKEIGTISFKHADPQPKQDWIDDCKIYKL